MLQTQPATHSLSKRVASTLTQHHAGFTVIIRTAIESDHDAVLDLLQYLNPDDPPVPDKVSRKTYSQILEADNFTIAVAEIDQVIVGTCYLNVIPNLTRNCSPYGLIENVVSHPDYRRQGIGQALIKHALALAYEKDCYKVMLLTGRDENVHQFYESCDMKSGKKTAFIARFDDF